MSTPPLGHDRDAALLFALVAERLSRYFEFGQWPNDGPMRVAAGDWLRRAKVVVASPRLRELVAGSDDLARQIAGALSREAGLYLTHEMLESLDPNHRSEAGQAIMDQCVAWAASRCAPTAGDVEDR